jgi:hypothetical protein
MKFRRDKLDPNSNMSSTDNLDDRLALPLKDKADPNQASFMTEILDPNLAPPRKDSDEPISH